MLTLRSLRDHYLRDVVAIKYHTEKVIEVATPLVTDEDGDPERSEGEILLQHRSELKGIPSATLKEVIDDAKNSLTPTSSFLKDSLIKAGLLEPTGRLSMYVRKCHTTEPFILSSILCVQDMKPLHGRKVVHLILIRIVYIQEPIILV